MARSRSRQRILSNRETFLMFKDLIVHLDGGEEDEVRIAHAEAIASRCEAHLTGLFVNPLPEYAYVLAIQSGFAPAGLIADLDTNVRRGGGIAVARLKERWTRIGVPNEMRCLEAGVSVLPSLCASEARWADLYVATSPYRYGAAPGWESLVESVLFESGRGVYLIPPQCKVRQAIRSVLVAWRGTRESARAIAEALPLLQASTVTRIVMVNSSEPNDRNVRGSDIAAHLDRHGIKVELTSLEAGEETVAGTLLNEAHRMSADLIVMGGYGHSRLREWILGGTTREMIEGSDIPILMAH
jgi:nucleotide-binding universal stress UspA family protein